MPVGTTAWPWRPPSRPLPAPRTPTSPSSPGGSRSPPATRASPPTCTGSARTGRAADDRGRRGEPAALGRGIDLGDRQGVADLARSLVITVGERVVADGSDITEAIRGAEVNAVVSAVAANPGVRSVLVERPRQWVAERRGGVVEGRDIGSVVFPHADLKIYLTASESERARRRPEEGADAVARRDRLDSTRSVSPLGVADGARVIDTTERSVEDIVEEVVAWL